MSKKCKKIKASVKDCKPQSVSKLRKIEIFLKILYAAKD